MPSSPGFGPASASRGAPAGPDSGAASDEEPGDEAAEPSTAQAPAGVATVLLRALRVPEGRDETVLEDYHADTDDPGVVTTPEQASGSEVTA